jgi:hypothetical protein
MAKGNRKKKRKERPRPNNPGPKRPRSGPLLYVSRGGGLGIDYSVAPVAAGMTDPSFVENLRNADVQAIAYGELNDSKLGRVPMVSLVVGSPPHAVKAFAEFHRWEHVTSGDAVRLMWRFRSGSYDLMVGPELEDMMFRCMGFERFRTPLVFGTYYCKRLDQVGQLTWHFRDYCMSWHSPFFFGALARDSTGDFAPVVEPLLKFKASMVDVRDDDGPETSFAEGVFVRDSPSFDLNPETRAGTRARAMRVHFPVTLERLRRRDRRGLPAVLRDWQVEQAAANLVLSADLCGGEPHFLSLPHADLVENLTAAVSRRLEVADGRPLPLSLTDEAISDQALLDGNALLRSLGLPVAKDLTDLADKLASRGLL